MKASKILAGLSAVSIAASMLSMVAASADETEKLTVDEGVAADNFGFDDDGDFTETDNVVDVDADATTGVADADKKGGNKKTGFTGYPWYKYSVPSVSSKTSFPGWPGWGVTAFPSGWEWFEGIKSLKDKTWEVFGTKDLDVAAPGYLVFEFENGKKWLVPASVDENGQFVTDEAYIPYMNVTKIYFLYEVSEAPYFKLTLDKFTVNGKDVELNKDNWADKIKYAWTDDDGNFYSKSGQVFCFDRTNNTEYGYAVDDSDQYILDDEGNRIVNLEGEPTYYQAIIFDKNVKDDCVINHGLVLWGTKVTATFTVDGIGKIPVHGGVFNGDGDDKGNPHTHVDPDEAGGQGVQKQNLDKYPVNPKFSPSDTCSKDLYDQLVEVYNSDPDHKSDAEIRFKTVSDKGGILVANFLNIWELDKDKDGTQRHWLQEFKNGYAQYIVKKKIPVTTVTETVLTKKIEVAEFSGYNNASAEKEEDREPIWEYETQEVKTEVDNGDGTKTTTTEIVKTDRIKHKTVEAKLDGSTGYWEMAKDADGNYDYTLPPVYTKFDKQVKKDTKTEDVEHWVFDGGEYDGIAVDENGKPLETPYVSTMKFLPDEKAEDAYCWHPYFVTENGLVDVVTKNYMGNSKTNTPEYTALTDSQIKYLKDNNGMYYNDDIHHAAYGHFVVFGDNTEREYSYRIKAEAVKSILDSVQRSAVQRNSFVYRHGAVDIVPWVLGQDGVQYNAYNQLIMPDDERADGFTKDYEAQHWLDSQIATNPDGSSKDDRYEHARATHGAVWLQCCEGTYIRDVRVHAYTNLLLENEVPKALYNKDNYDALYPTKPAESAASSAAAAQPTAAEAAADENAGSGAAAGFGIAGLLLAGAAMVCAKKKDR